MPMTNSPREQLLARFEEVLQQQSVLLRDRVRVRVPDEDGAGRESEIDARTLVTLVRGYAMLEKLGGFKRASDTETAAQRQQREEQIRAALERRLSSLPGAGSAARVPAKPEG